jgi:hypothetical protein
VERSELAPVLDPAVVEFIQGGVAVGVATRDDDLRPEFARGWGPEVSADGRSLRLCVTAPEGSRMRAGFTPSTTHTRKTTERRTSMSRYRIDIDRFLCSGFGTCTELAPYLIQSGALALGCAVMLVDGAPAPMLAAVGTDGDILTDTASLQRRRRLPS